MRYYLRLTTKDGLFRVDQLTKDGYYPVRMKIIRPLPENFFYGLPADLDEHTFPEMKVREYRFKKMGFDNEFQAHIIDYVEQ